MTNKFRDTQKTLDEYGEWVTRREFLIIKKALTIAAELQDEAETIKALDDAGDRATQGNWYISREIIDIDYYNAVKVEGVHNDFALFAYGDGYPYINYKDGDARFISQAANARPLFKKLAKLVKEGEK